MDHLEVLDVTGRMVLTQRTANELDLGALTTGAYHVVLVGDSGRRMLRVLKQ